MKKGKVVIEGLNIDVYSLNTVVVGTGAAGFNAADCLHSFGQTDIAIVTEGVNMGTSRNTGSDKQTFYKLTMAGDAPDSVMDMARTLFDGGSMHGDLALIEAALSARNFFKLVNIGIPFPHSKYGEYAGYKTDHDPKQRATSAGPLTSRYMTEKLQRQVLDKGIKIFDKHLVIGILTDTEYSDEKNGLKPERKSVGLITLNTNELDKPNMGFALFNCTNIIYATGGPAGMYEVSVYPESQIGSHGIAFEAGVKGVNLTESQFGIASIKFRWNLSGTYQQVIPRYVSTDMEGNDEREFLDEYFDDTGKMLNAIFLKGYQWPFDPRKIKDSGSSLIDILVYNETNIKNRRVCLDYSKNPSCAMRNGTFDFSLLSDEAYGYLRKSGALYGTPFERLAKMNRPAIDLYLKNGIDLNKEYLEIAVCAQHNNGGLIGNIWWESNLRHFFPVGEANGTFGVYRPGGSALNSTQTGSLRAAQFICSHYTDGPCDIKRFTEIVRNQVSIKIQQARGFLTKVYDRSNLIEQRKAFQKRMTAYGGHIRSIEGCSKAIEDCLNDIKGLFAESRLRSPADLPDAFRNRDILLTQYTYLNAIKDYMKRGGKSRGSYLVRDPEGELPVKGLSETFRYKLDGGFLSQLVQETEFTNIGGVDLCQICLKPVRPIPCEDNWFENIWNENMK